MSLEGPRFLCLADVFRFNKGYHKCMNQCALRLTQTQHRGHLTSHNISGAVLLNVFIPKNMAVKRKGVSVHIGKVPSTTYTNDAGQPIPTMWVIRFKTENEAKFFADLMEYYASAECANAANINANNDEDDDTDVGEDEDEDYGEDFYAESENFLTGLPGINNDFVLLQDTIQDGGILELIQENVVEDLGEDEDDDEEGDEGNLIDILGGMKVSADKAPGSQEETGSSSDSDSDDVIAIEEIGCFSDSDDETDADLRSDCPGSPALL